MSFLIFSILSNTAIFLLFKWFLKLRVRTLPAIVFNYYTATALGIFLLPDRAAAFETALTWPAWVTGAMALGLAFIAIFYLTAITAQQVGMAVSTVASKMSLALSALLFVWMDPSDHATLPKVAAIILAVSGVVLASLQDGPVKIGPRALAWPILLLLLCTVVDFGLAWLSKGVTTDNDLTLFSTLSFLMACGVGTLLLLVQVLRKKITFGKKELVAGVALGLINFGSIYFLIRTYDSGILPRSTILQVNNLGVVLAGAVIAVIVFGEKLSRRNLAGIALSVLALLLLLSEQ
jgi:drug/metabolite transporter (DMT)-like permease